MDAQEMNKACELAFLVAREGVEQDPPIDPPASMRMFLYVRQFPQRALTVARQTMAEDPEFRARVAAVATVENSGANAVEWLAQSGVLVLDDLASPDPTDGTAGAAGQSQTQTAVSNQEDTTPVTKEAIRTELDELKSLVGQLADERAAVGDELSGLETRLDEADHDIIEPQGLAGTSDPDAGAGSAPVVSSTVSAAGGSMAAQVRSLHADLRQARSDRDAAQEAKEVAILEQAELMEELENLRALSTNAEGRLNDLEAKIETVSGQKSQLEEEKARLDAETTRLAEEAKSVSSERDDAVAHSETLTAERAEAEAKLASVTADLDKLTAEMNEVRSSAGASVTDLRAAIAAQEALSSHVDSLSAAQAAARSEMERVNAALADRATSDGEKISALKSALSSVVAERDALVAKLALVRSSVTTVQGEMATLDSNVGDVESSAGTLGDRVTDLSSSVEVIEFEEIQPVDTAVLDTPVAPAMVIPAMPDTESPDTESLDTESLDTESLDSESHEAEAEADADNATNTDVEYGDDSDLEATAEETSADEAADTHPDSNAEAADISAAEVSETDFTAGLLNDFPDDAIDPGPTAESGSEEAVSEETESENIDEVHALVAETVATFDASDEPEKSRLKRRGKGGLTSLFTSTAPSVIDEEPAAEEQPIAEAQPVAEAEASVAEIATETADSGDDSTIESVVASGDAVSSTRTPIQIPEDVIGDQVAVARHVVRTEDAVLLIDGDPVAAMGWPSVDRIDQRRNLVHFLSALAGNSGVAPDVLFDRDNGTDRLPDSRSVRVRITNEEGSVAAQVNRLIDTYPGEWPVVVVTDNVELATEVAMKGATILDNGQLLDLFIAS